MRWAVELPAPSGGTAATVTVESDSWAGALSSARGGVSIRKFRCEFENEGVVRVHDLEANERYVVRPFRASVAPSSPAPTDPPPAVDPLRAATVPIATQRASRPAVPVASPGFVVAPPPGSSVVPTPKPAPPAPEPPAAKEPVASAPVVVAPPAAPVVVVAPPAAAVAAIVAPEPTPVPTPAPAVAPPPVVAAPAEPTVAAAPPQVVEEASPPPPTPAPEAVVSVEPADPEPVAAAPEPPPTDEVAAPVPAPAEPADVTILASAAETEAARAAVVVPVEAPLPPPPAHVDDGADALVWSSVLFERSQEPGPTNPLTYRERVLLVAKGTTDGEAESLARHSFATLKRSLATHPRGRYVTVAVFDHAFTGRPSEPPIVVLRWKDWRPDGAEVVFRPAPSLSIVPAAPSIPAPAAPAEVVEAPAVVSVPSEATAAAFPEAATPPVSEVEAPAPLDVVSLPPPSPEAVVAPAPAAEPVLPEPVAPPAVIASPAVVEPPPSELAPVEPPPVSNVDPKRAAADEEFEPNVAAPTASVTPSPLPEPTEPSPMTDVVVAKLAPPPEPPPAALIEPLEAPLAEPVEPVAAAPVAPAPVAQEPTPVVATPPVEPSTTAPEAPAAPAASVPEPTPPVPAEEPPVPATASVSAVPPVEVPATAQPTPGSTSLLDDEPERPRFEGGRRGPDLLSDLFDAVMDLSFQHDVADLCHFTTGVLTHNLRCDAVMVMNYDINRDEFVVVGEANTHRAGERVRANHGSYGLATRTKRGVLVGAVRTDEAADASCASGPALFVPALHRERLFALLHVARQPGSPPFEADELDAVTYVAAQVAEALSHHALRAPHDGDQRPGARR